MILSNIHIRAIERSDFDQVTRLYYQYLGGDLIGSAGKRAFRTYLGALYRRIEGSVFCAVAENGQIVGFTAGVVERERFNFSWLLKNIFWLTPLLIVKSFFSGNIRRLVWSRLHAKFRARGREVAVFRGEVKEPGRAMSLWLVVDDVFRGKGNDIASRLIASLEQDLKKKGASRVYGFTALNNLPTIFVYAKNGWKIQHNENNCVIAKAL